MALKLLKAAMPRAFSPRLLHPLSLPFRSFSIELRSTDFNRADREIHEKQLLYRSRQRGWLELDLILGSWANENLHKLSSEDLILFENIVCEENPDLVKWLIEKIEPPQEKKSTMMEKLIHYTHGEGKKWIKRNGNQ